MTKRRTRIILSIPWDDEDQEHPAGWGYDVLLGTDEPVLVIDFTEVEMKPGG